MHVLVECYDVQSYQSLTFTADFFMISSKELVTGIVHLIAVHYSVSHIFV